MQQTVVMLPIRLPRELLAHCERRQLLRTLGLLADNLPESIYAGLILFLFFFDWGCASPTAPSTVFSLSK